MSWIRAFFHPFKTSEELNELQNSIEEFSQYAESLERKIEAAEDDCRRAKSEAESLQRRMRETENTVENLLRQLADCRNERDEYFRELLESDAQLDQINELATSLSKFEDLKKRYEEKIEKQKSRIADLEEALKLKSSPGVAGELTPIDFSKPKIAIETSSPLNKPRSQEPKKNKEPQYVSAPIPALLDEVDSQEKTDRNRNSQASDDEWFQPLPDDVLI